MIAASVIETAREFHSRAGVSVPSVRGPVIEVAHQPLFLPSPGFFRKIALGCWLAEKRGGTCVFGFVDDDSALFPAMWSSRMPADNKPGYEKIGFGIEPSKKTFSALPKPKMADVEKNAEKTGLDFLPDCLDASDSLSDFNALVAAKICGMMGLKPLFFEYSKLPANAMANQVAFFRAQQRDFVSAYNASIRKRGIAMKPMAEDELPLWAVERDGTKKALHVGEAANRYAFKAVARNIAFADFLGSDCYVSGRGAMEEYGAVSHDVSRALEIREPETFVWLDKGVYRGASGSDAALAEEVAALRARVNAAKKKESAAIAAKDASARKRAWEEKKSAERSLQKKQGVLLEGERKNKQAETDYSIADLLSAVKPREIAAAWSASLDGATAKKKETHVEYATTTRFSSSRRDA